MRRQRISRAEQRIKTREAIVATAGRLFLRRGIEATSIDAVAAELGLTKGAVYANFQSKSELIEAVGHFGAVTAQLLDVLVRADLPLRERLRRLGHDLVTSRPGRDLVLLDLEYVIYAARNRQWGKHIRQGRRTALNDLAARFRAVNRARGEKPPLDEERLVDLIHIIGRGVIQELTADSDAIAPADVEAMFMLLGGSSKGAPRPR